MKYLFLKPLFFLMISYLGATAVALPGTGGESEPESEFTNEALSKLSAEMQSEVEALRGWKFKNPVDVGFFTCEEVRAFLHSDKEENVWNEEARAETALKAIGLIPKDCDPEEQFEEAMMAFVPDGIYDHEKKILRLVKQGDMDPSSLDIRLTLAHELAHALDDQYFDLARLDKVGGGTSDMGHVWGAVIEGSGVTIQERYNIKAKTLGGFDFQKQKQSQMEEMAKMRTLFEAPPCVSVFMARFPCGIRFLQRGDMQKVMALFMGTSDPGSVGEALQTAVAQPPRSSEQILHPEKYWKKDCRDEPVILNDEEVAKRLAEFGLHIEHKDTVGELLCAIVSSPADRTVNPMAMAMPGYWTDEGAAGWGGDRLYLAAPEAGDDASLQPARGLRIAWFTMWDSAKDCDEFVELYEKHRILPERSTFRLGNQGAVFLFRFSEDERLQLEGRLKSKLPA
ncbi:MAG: hypothetical protein ABIK28_07835, partial [Planctomycetota bacterium]